MTRIAPHLFHCLASLLVLAGSATAHVNLKANRAQQPVAIDSFERIGGFVGERVHANVENYLKPFDIERHVRAVERRDHRAWSWVVGEQPGKWLESIALNAAWMGDEPLRRQAETMLARIIESQEPSGYVGVTDPAIRTPDKPLRGMDAYELYFMMHGLLTAGEEWNNEQALQAARRLGDYFESTIGPGKAEFWPSDLRYPENREQFVGGQSDIAGHGVHYSWEGTLLIDPMLRLYELTGETKYLDWSKWAIANIDRWSGWDAFSSLEKVAAGTMGIHEVQPYVHSHTFQMNFLGFLRMYQLTGDESYLRKVRGVWDDIARRQMYITGGVSVGEHYAAGFIRPITGHVVETCATMSWMQLTQYLLELTGDPKYADAIERLMLNHVFAAQTIDGDNVRYHTPPNGTKNDYFHGPNCCTGSGHRIISMVPLFFYATDREGLIINQYGSSSAAIELGDGRGAIEVVQQTSYPETETIRLHLTPSQSITEMKVRLRIPAWVSNPRLVTPEGMTVQYRWVDQDNRPRTATTRPQGVACYAEISGQWQRDVTTTIDMTLPMETRWIERENHVGDRIVRLQGGGWEQMREAVEVPYAPYALLRGPIVYVYDTVWQTEDNPLPPDRLGYDPDSSAPLRQAPTPARAMGPGLMTQLHTPDGQKAEVLMLPFTNIGRWYRNEAEKDRVRNSNAYPYAVWLNDVNSDEFRQAAAVSEQLRNAIDYVVIGDPASESDHEVRGGSTGAFGGRTYRHAPPGDSISWTLEVDTEAPSTLVVTYWGDEPEARTFDILINGRKIATERLYRDVAGTFIDRRYDIPFDLIEGRTTQFGQKVDSVRVEFTSQESTAGGIFGLRTERKPGHDSEENLTETGRHEFTWCNPNAQVIMRDTQIIPNYDDGKFYAIGTLFWGGADEEGNAGFRLFVSENLKDWEPGPWIMKQSEIPEEAWYRRQFWAPEIHKIGDKWYFTYNCHGTQPIDRDLYVGPHGSGVSVADKITGPYRILAQKPLAPWPSNDVTLFQDDDGKVYAFFNDGFFNVQNHPSPLHSIYVAEIDLDQGVLVEDPKRLLTQQKGFESAGIEGAYVVKVDGIYYLFYSGWHQGYAVGYATARNVYGPYTRAENNPLFGARRDGGLVRNGKIIRDIDHPYREIGHNQIFRGPDGNYWTSCHAYLKEGDDRFGAHLIYDRLEFRDGKVITDAPTWTPQTVRIAPEMLKHFPGLIENQQAH